MDKYIKEINPWEKTAEEVSRLLGIKFKDWPEPRTVFSGGLCAGCIVEERSERLGRTTQEYETDE